MPERRVFFFLQDNTATNLNAAGNALFDAAVDFAMRPPSASTSGTTLPFIWTCGLYDTNQITGATGGGPNAQFVQENGSVNALPGAADNPVVDQQSDNDYYFAGDYSITIPSVVAMYGDYTPLGVVAADEEGAERALVPGDFDLRYHFNLPTSLKTNDVLAVSFAENSLDDRFSDNRYGVAVYINGILVQPEIVVRRPQLEVNYTTPEVTLASVNAQTGPGYDNIVSLRGIDYSADGGGSWMGLDYIQLNGGTPTVALKFTTAVVSGGKVTLTWTGSGNLETAPAATGPWTPVTPKPASPYTEDILAGQNRFYHLKQ
jgi:hypothetical protein